MPQQIGSPKTVKVVYQSPWERTIQALGHTGIAILAALATVALPIVITFLKGNDFSQKSIRDMGIGVLTAVLVLAYAAAVKYNQAKSSEVVPFEPAPLAADSQAATPSMVVSGATNIHHAPENTKTVADDEGIVVNGVEITTTIVVRVDPVTGKVIRTKTVGVSQQPSPQAA
jgi:hypothetical protein